MIRKNDTLKAMFRLLLLLSVVGVLEYLPTVKHARESFPENFARLSCRDILNARPWYGQINPWLWFWLISTPIIIFSLKPNTPAWARAMKPLIAIGLGYIVINLGTHLAMDIRNAPFHGEGISYVNGILVSSQTDVIKQGCFDIADGAKFVFAFYFAWIFALIYTGWWEIIWIMYHKRKTKLVDESFKRDWVSLIVIFISIAITVFIAGLIIAEVINAYT